MLAAYSDTRTSAHERRMIILNNSIAHDLPADPSEAFALGSAVNEIAAHVLPSSTELAPAKDPDAINGHLTWLRFRITQNDQRTSSPGSSLESGSARPQPY